MSEKNVQHINWRGLSDKELVELMSDPTVRFSDVLMEQARRKGETYGGRSVVLDPAETARAEELLHSDKASPIQKASALLALGR